MHTLPVLPWSHLWSSPFCTLLTPLMSAMSPFVVDLHVCSQRNNPVFSKGTREHILFLFAFLILANSGRLWFWLKGIANNFYLWISEWIINSKFKLKNKVNQLNFYISLKFTYKILIPNLMVLGDGALGRCLSFLLCKMTVIITTFFQECCAKFLFITKKWLFLNIQSIVT